MSTLVKTASRTSHLKSSSSVPRRSLEKSEKSRTASLTSRRHSRALSSSPVSPISRTLSDFLPAPRSNTFTLSLVPNPRIFQCFLTHTRWPDLRSLLQTCKDTWKTFDDPQLKDIILAHFIPTYRHALRLRELDRFQEIQFTLADLDLFLTSRDLPLHRYPVHALAQTSALFPTPEQERKSKRLSRLCEAHSRVVLLLQSLVHSSSSPLPMEPSESANRLRFAQSNLRELTFPSPLSNEGSITRRQASDSHAPPPSSYSAPNVLASPRSRSKPRSSPSSRSEDSVGSKKSLSRRLSLFDFGGNPTPPPPPSEPRELAHHSRGWRKSFLRSSSSSDDVSSNSVFSTSSGHKRFTSENEKLYMSRKGSPPSTPRRAMPAPTGKDGLNPNALSPHDIALASSRNRAPVLRVYVPCSELSDSDENGSISLCEDQLEDWGLWNHLSTGDIVCNLGFVPPESPETSPAGSRSGSSLSDGDQSPSRRSSSGGHPLRQWLVFVGNRLVTFSALEAPPVEDALTLPTPFYYAHLMPAMHNPVFYLKKAPHVHGRAPREIDPQLAMSPVPTKVRSPHSPSGFAVVRRHMWTARIIVGHALVDVGDGWRGEWILEAEGTSEGKAALELFVGEGGKKGWEWEIVRESSTGGRLWLRLLRSLEQKRNIQDLSSL